MPEGIAAAMRSFFQERFEFGEEVFNGIQVGRVRRQIPQACACGGDGLLHARHFVAGQVIRNNDVTRLQRRAEQCLHIHEERFAVPRAVQDHRRGDGIHAQACDKGGGVPVSVRHRSEAARPFGGPASGAGHLRADPRFIQEDQRRHIKRGLVGLPLGSCRLHVVAFLLAGAQRFF